MSQKKLFENNPPMIGVGTFTASNLAKKLVMEVLENNRLSYGPMLQKFEVEFAKIHGSKFGIMSNSGTSALQLALQTLKEINNWEDGDEVIIPAVTFVATANIVLHNRMIPKLVDVDPIYYSLDPKHLESVVSSKTRAIIPVHLFGQPADMDPILEFARKYSLKVIEDSAETMYANYKGRRVGSLGDIGCFSTYVAHLLVTGVGGINTTNNNEYAIKIRSLLNHGRDSIYLNIDDDKDKNIEELIPIIEKRFKFISIGHSFRVTEMEGALGLAQLETWQPDIAKRRNNANYLTQTLSKYLTEIQLPAIRPGCDHSFMMFPIVIKNEKKQKLVNFLESNGIETRDMLPLTNQPIYKDLLGWYEGDYPVAQWINNNGFYIGCHQDLTLQDLEYISTCFDAYFNPKSQVKNQSVGLAIFAEHEINYAEIKRMEEYFPLFTKIKLFINEDFNKKIINEITSNTNYEIILYKNNLLDAAKNCFEKYSENIIFIPLNGKWNVKDIPRIIMMLSQGNDLVIASRFTVGGKRQWRGGSISSFGNRFFNFLISLIFNENLSDSFSSFRGIKIEKIKKESIFGTYQISMFQLTTLALYKKWKICELPTSELIENKRNSFSDLWTAIFALIFLIKIYFNKVKIKNESRSLPIGKK